MILSKGGFVCGVLSWTLCHSVCAPIAVPWPTEFVKLLGLTRPGGWKCRKPRALSLGSLLARSLEQGASEAERVCARTSGSLRALPC